MARDYHHYARILSREDIAKIAMAWWSLACEICADRGNFTLVRNGIVMKCDTRGSTTGRS
jgi:hypothetical protein